MHLIVGLGNPGPKYLWTRHNIGFQVLDFVVQELGVSFKEKWQSLFVKTDINGAEVILQKPQAYMNLSGASVVGALQFFKLKPSDLLVIQDDIAMPFGALRLQKNRSAGGHNGIKDITQKLGTQDYSRLKVGVGMPNGNQAVDSYVLSDFSKEEQKKLPFLYNDIEKALLDYLKLGLDKTANKHNRKAYPD